MYDDEISLLYDDELNLLTVAHNILLRMKSLLKMYAMRKYEDKCFYEGFLGLTLHLPS
jgi:hypothetical protein